MYDNAKRHSTIVDLNICKKKMKWWTDKERRCFCFWCMCLENLCSETSILNLKASPLASYRHQLDQTLHKSHIWSASSTKFKNKINKTQTPCLVAEKTWGKSKETLQFEDRMTQLTWVEFLSPFHFLPLSLFSKKKRNRKKKKKKHSNVWTIRSKFYFPISFPSFPSNQTKNTANKSVSHNLQISALNSTPLRKTPKLYDSTSKITSHKRNRSNLTWNPWYKNTPISFYLLVSGRCSFTSGKQTLPRQKVRRKGVGSEEDRRVTPTLTTPNNNTHHPHYYIPKNNQNPKKNKKYCGRWKQIKTRLFVMALVRKGNYEFIYLHKIW